MTEGTEAPAMEAPETTEPAAEPAEATTKTEEPEAPPSLKREESAASSDQAPLVDDLLVELVGTNEKYIKDTTALHLGSKGITKLSGLEKFKNLETLYLSDNKLTHLSGLEKNFRVRRLYLANNRLFTLKGDSVKALRNVNQLDLTNNKLRDLNKVLAKLSHMKFLYELELSGNACCEEPDYRLTVVHHLPSLDVLDSRQVTEEERHKSRVLFGVDTTSEVLAFGKLAVERAGRPPPVPVSGPVSGLEQDLNKAVKTITAENAAKAEREDRLLHGLTEDGEPAAPARATSLPLPPGWPLADKGAKEEAGGAGSGAKAESGRVRDLLRLTNMRRPGADPVADLTEQEISLASSVKADSKLTIKSQKKDHGVKAGTVVSKLNVVPL